MLTEAFAAAFADLWVAITAINLYYFLNLQPEAGTGTTTTTSAAESSSSVVDFQMIFPILVAAGGLYAAVALVHRSLRQAKAAAAAAGGGGHRRLSDLVGFVSAAAGLLELFLFVDDVGALGRSLGLAAARVLPVASTATFFLGMVLIILVHIRAGGEGGGGAVVVREALVSVVTKMAFAAAAGLVCMMAIALCAKKY